MPQRIYIPLDQAEMSALLNVAEKLCRHPRDQARFYVLQALKSEGVLHTSLTGQKKSQEVIHGNNEPNT